MDWRCPSCGTAADAAFCPACGERRLTAPAAPLAGVRGYRARLARSAAARWTTRLRRSLAELASPPGLLTLHWIEGRRVGYLAPVTLFLYVNVAFFLIQSGSHVSILSFPLPVHLANDLFGVQPRLFAWLAPHGAADDPHYIALFDALERVNAKALVIAMVPAFALAMLPLRAAPGTRFGNALAYSAHFFAFALIALSALFPLIALVGMALTARGYEFTSAASLTRVDRIVTTVQSLIFGWYVSRSLRTLTALPLWARLAASVALVTVLYLLLRVYHLLVFVVTLLAM